MSTSAVPAEPPGYAGMKATEKIDWLWNTLIGETLYRPTTRPDLTMASPPTMLRIAGPTKTLAWTLDNDTDVMAPTRPKIIHAQGSVARIEFETSGDSPYSGVLAAPPAGGAIGLLRMSLAVPPSGKRAVTPGIGLKLLVDGKPALDLLAMNHTVGQGRDINLFANSFTHDLTYEHTQLRPPQKLLQLFFKRVSAQPRRLTIDHLVETTADGSVVAEPRRPGRIVFLPHPDVRRVFRRRADEDFRDTLARVDEGSALYDVVAVHDETDEPSHTIGVLRLTGRFCSSTGGDRLFFRHVQDPADRLPVRS